MATPLLVVPVIGLMRSQVSVAHIGLFVAAFGALGHHVPGLMRAYGDGALFERFKTRLIIAPLFLLAVAVPATMYELHGLTVVVLLWGVWHGALQVYGFLRIYDAKARSFGRFTARLDWLLCIAWFGAGLFYSPGRMVSLIEAFYQGGGPLIATSAFQAFKTAWLAGAVTLSVVFIAKLVIDGRSGRPVSPVKPVSMALSFGFWWYTTTMVSNAVLGVALFEIFHDIQYLAIVWLYNKNRVAKTKEVGGFTRFLFRNSWVMVGLYVGICFAYGAIRYLPELASLEIVRKALIGVVAASTLLHFYFDGFIWKVREQTTSEGLGLESEGRPADARPTLAPWMVHALKWSVFVLPVVLLGAAQLRGAAPTFAQYENMVALVPDSAYLRNNYGFQLKARGRPDEAVAEYERAIALDPDYARARSNLGVALLQRGDVPAAVEELRRAVALDADYAEAHTNLATALARQGDDDGALEHYRLAVSYGSDLMEAHNGLAQTLMRRKRVDEAVAHFERAIELGPEHADLRTHLGLALILAGRRHDALKAFDAALERNPDDLVSLETSAWLLATATASTPADAARAVRRGERASELTSYLNASVLDTLGAAYAAAGEYERAEVAARTASAIASDAGQRDLVRDIEARIDGYRRGEPFRVEGGRKR